LDGILCHESIVYEGITRPSEIIRAFDKPASQKIHDLDDPENCKILQDYFNDLYGLFMRKLSQFIAEPGTGTDNELKLQAMLQELIKVKKLLALPDGEAPRNASEEA
jgi:hypothetical protein